MPGARTLRTMLDRHTFRLSDSDLEIYFRPLALAAGFPLPLSKQWVLGFEVDFHFPDHGLIVATDGLALPPDPGPAGADGQTRPDPHLTRLPRPPLHHWQIANAPNEVATSSAGVRRSSLASYDAGGLRFAEAVASGRVGAGRPVHPVHDSPGLATPKKMKS